MILTQEEKAAALQAIASANDGILEVDAVWQSARSENHPLHNYYEWDVEKAAVEHWRETSRRIIQSCKVTIVHEDVVIKCPVFVRDPKTPAGEQGYASTDLVARKHADSAAVLQEELYRIKTLVERGRILAAHFGMSKRFESDLKEIIRRPSRRAAA